MRNHIGDKLKRQRKLFGELLKRKRIDMGLSMARVSYLTRISRGILSFIESGKRFPSLESAEKISIFFNIDLDSIPTVKSKEAIHRKNFSQKLYDFGNRIHKYRIENRITREELAKTLKMSKRRLYNIEHNLLAMPPSENDLYNICSILGEDFFSSTHEFEIIPKDISDFIKSSLPMKKLIRNIESVCFVKKLKVPDINLDALEGIVRDHQPT